MYDISDYLFPLHFVESVEEQFALTDARGREWDVELTLNDTSSIMSRFTTINKINQLSLIEI